MMDQPVITDWSWLLSCFPTYSNMSINNIIEVVLQKYFVFYLHKLKTKMPMPCIILMSNKKLDIA